MERVFKATDFKYIKWYHRLLLPFCKTYISCDPARKGGDYSCTMKFKKFRGKIYITDTRLTTNQQHRGGRK